MTEVLGTFSMYQERKTNHRNNQGFGRENNGEYLRSGWITTILKQPPEVYKKSIPKDFTRFTGKHLSLSLFLVKLQARRIQHSYFLWILRNCQEHLFWRTSAYGCFWPFSKWFWFHTFTCISIMILTQIYNMVLQRRCLTLQRSI